MRVRLALAFVAVAVGSVVLTIAGLNLAMFVQMGQGMHGMHATPQDSPMTGNMLAAMSAALVRWSIGSALVAALVAAGVGVWLAGRIAGPLAQLREAVRRLDLRDLSYRVPVVGEAEVADVAAAFNRMVSRLQKEDGSRRQLLADVAHELRHPLAVLRARLEMLQDGVVPLSPTALVNLHDEVLRMNRLIGDLRDLSLAEVGTLALSRRPVALAGLVQPLLDNLEPVATSKGVELVVSVPPDLPTINADPDRIRQVVVNLLDNSLRFTPRGGRVELSALPAQGGVEVTVADTGTGIDPADLPHVFDRFYRAEKSRSREGGGTGLGLTIARSLVELHGGQIRVESSPGRGSRFTVYLPGPAEPQ